MFKKVWKIVIPNYIDKVPISQRRRTKYYRKNESTIASLAKKYKDGITSGKYYWDNKGYLIDFSKNRVVANPMSAGTPKYWTINGQRLYDGTLHYAVRAKVSRFMHIYLKDFIEEIPTIKLNDIEKIRVWIDMYRPIGTGNWDVDNQWVWTKWFLDTLVEHEKIPGDHVKYVTSAGQITFIESDERKLVFNIQII
tara:strand:- start:554 stop:1138 length:585 start_codon:yes stop_codon:yes gene_type:complete